MRRSKSEIYLHLVWATRERQPLITPAIRERLYPFLEMQAKHLGCHVLALGGMPDHIHLVVRTPATVCAAQLVKQVKGSSSALVNDLTKRTPYFRWQDGYGVFSLCRPLLSKVVRYAENQERHHSQGPLWGEWEEADEEVADEEVPGEQTPSTRLTSYVRRTLLLASGFQPLGFARLMDVLRWLKKTPSATV